MRDVARRNVRIAGTEGGMLWALSWSAVAADLSWPEDHAELGSALLFADFDGDGADELAVGAPGSGSVGAVHVWKGGAFPPSGAPTLSLAAAPSELGGGFGTTLAAGDVDGDGYRDLVVGTPHAGTAPGHTEDGAFTVYVGSSFGLRLPAVGPWRGSGDGNLGAALATGDADGDGYDDVLVGAPRANGIGAAHLYRGSATGLSGAPAWSTVPPYGIAADLGTAVAMGDVNGDGVDDLAVGSPRISGVSVWYGGPTGPGAVADWSMPVSGQPDVGATLAIGDTDGDGYADLVIGDPLGGRPGRAGEGLVAVFRGSATGLAASPAWVEPGGVAGVWLGRALALGDPDGDGDADLFVGDLGTPGSWAGAVHGYASGPQSISAAPVLSVPGVQASEELGAAIATGDFDGDGLDEVAAGAPYATGTYLDEGRVSLVRGR